MRRAFLAAALACALAQPLAAQEPAPAHSSWLVHYGKWAAAGAAVGFAAFGIREHGYAQTQWNALIDICRNNNASCEIGANGRYVDPAAEYRYQNTITFDHRARRWLIGAQAALLSAAALFIADLQHHDTEPGNIPFHPLSIEATPTPGGARLGLRIAF